MFRAILIVVVLFGLAIPAASGQEEQRFEGAGMDVWVPGGWQVTETDDDVVLTNLPTDKPDWLATIEPGRVTAHLAPLSALVESGILTDDPAFLAGTYTGVALTTNAFMSAFSPTPSAEPLTYTISELVEEDGVWSVEMTIGGGKPVDLLIVVVEDAFVLTASAPRGELGQWRDVLNEIAAKAVAATA